MSSTKMKFRHTAHEVNDGEADDGVDEEIREIGDTLGQHICGEPIASGKPLARDHRTFAWV